MEESKDEMDYREGRKLGSTGRELVETEGRKEGKKEGREVSRKENEGKELGGGCQKVWAKKSKA